MSGSPRPATPTFKAVNAMDVTPADQSLRSVATATPPRNSISSRGSSSPTFDFRSATSASNMNSGSAASDTSGGAGEGSDAGHEKPQRKTEGSEGKAKTKTGKGTVSGKVKKKKGTKFNCSGFGPCNLSFTRSEHLARHIRKHTGERPFMCHCGRWFSRLDNLRQHSSTVHADEEIPNDSLAASGTRYQRHIRTERVRQPARSRAQSQSDVHSPEPQPPQPIQPISSPVLGTPMVDRSRRRPDPLVLPQDVSEPQDPAFNQYRNHTPPDSPSSTVSSTTSYFRSGGSTYRNRAAPYPPISQATSPTPTPTRHGSTLDSPFGTPSNSARNSVNFSTYGKPSHAFHARRLSMPVPPSPSLLNPSDARSLVLPPPAASPTGSDMTIGSRRDSIGPLGEDRRRTWHMGTPSVGGGSVSGSGYNSPLARDVISPTTHSFARTSLYGGADYSPITPPRQQATDRLPSIGSLLQDAFPDAPTTPRSNRASWASGPIEPSLPGTPDRRLSTDFGRPGPLLEGMPTRRVAAGQVRSAHGRSISNIETKRWGVVLQSNPFSGPWSDRDRREPPHIVDNRRNSGYIPPPNLTAPREHRQSFGSSGDSSVSEGVNTPVVGTVETARPLIFGEPGEPVFHSESPERQYAETPCIMSGVETTGRPATHSVIVHQQYTPSPIGAPDRPTLYPNVSRLDALVSVATGAAKI